MGVKVETARRLRASVFLVVTGLLVGSLIGYAVTPYEPKLSATAAAAAAANAAEHAPGGFLSNLHLPDFSNHHEPDEAGHEEGGAGEHSGGGDGDAHPEEHHEESQDEAHPAPSAPVTINGNVQSGKQSWANPEHRATYKVGHVVQVEPG